MKFSIFYLHLEGLKKKTWLLDFSVFSYVFILVSYFVSLIIFCLCIILSILYFIHFLHFVHIFIVTYQNDVFHISTWLFIILIFFNLFFFHHFFTFYLIYFFYNLFSGGHHPLFSIYHCDLMDFFYYYYYFIFSFWNWAVCTNWKFLVYSYKEYASSYKK